MKILSKNNFEYLNKTTVDKNIENNIKKFLGEKSKNSRNKRKLTNTRTRRN